VKTFPIRRSPWAVPFLVPLGAGHPTATVDEERVSVRVGWAGRADIPVGLIAAVGKMDWPWWFGVGVAVRIVRGLVAFSGGPGRMVVLELSEPVRVRTPLSWPADRIAIGVEDVEGFIAEIAQVRAGGGPEEG
jgi:hypothetical protein